MRELIDQSIEWEKIGAHPKENYKYEVTEAVIGKESGVLTITLRLNFVPPHLNMEKLRGILLHQFVELSGVRFHYEFEDVILSSKKSFPCLFLI